MSSPLPPRAPDWRTRAWRALYAPITPGAARSVVALFALTVVLSGANLLFTSYQVNREAHQWCATLGLLTSHPVPRPAHPAANPSRAQAYRYYTDFLDLRHRLGCG